jgi:hypothetical protein
MMPGAILLQAAVTSHLLDLPPPLLLYGGEVLLHYPRWVCSLREA